MEDAVSTAQSWIDAEDEWWEIVAELFALGRRLDSAEQADLELAGKRVEIAREGHLAALREWAKTQ